MTWQTNLINNLLVFGIMTGIGITAYCRVTNRGLGEVIAALREVNTPVNE